MRSLSSILIAARPASGAAAARLFLSMESLRELRRRLPGLTSSSLDSLLPGLRSNLNITLSSACKPVG